MLRIQEGAVCSRRLYGMNFRRGCRLEFRLNRFRFAQVFMEIFRFFISILEIQCLVNEQAVHQYRYVQPTDQIYEVKSK